LNGVEIVEAEIGWCPGSELRLGTDDLLKRGIQRGILLCGEQCKPGSKLLSSRLGLDQESDAISRTETLKTPVVCGLGIWCALSREQ
jgi:hypothetical protein